MQTFGNWRSPDEALVVASCIESMPAYSGVSVHCRFVWRRDDSFARRD